MECNAKHHTNDREGANESNSSSPTTTTKICPADESSRSSRPFYALLVGEITDFEETNIEEERRAKGDIGLYHALQKSQVTRKCASSTSPRSSSTPTMMENHIVHLKDEEATKRNAEKTLIRLLQLASAQQQEDNDNSNRGKYDFLFYFGGHGLERHFNTYGDGDVWTHEQLLNTLERHYSGHGVVWILLDCCYAGNFYRAVQDRMVASAWRQLDPPSSGFGPPTYVCIMSTPPDAVAEDDWTMTEALVYSIEQGHTTDQAMDHLSDRLAHVLSDLLTVYVHHPHDASRNECSTSSSTGSGALSAPFFRDNGYNTGDDNCNSAVHNNNNKTPSRLPTVIPITKNYLSKINEDDNDNGEMTTQIGDFVFAKWHGGQTSTATGACSSRYVFPLWFPGLVLAVNDNDNGNDNDDDDEQTDKAHHSTITVEFHDPSSSYKWVGTVQKSQLLHKTHFNHTEPPSNHDCKNPWSASCSALQLRLASNHQFITFAIPVGTKLRARWSEDGCLYDASVPCYSDLPWEDLVVDDDDDDHDERDAEPHVPEACVPVCWDDDEDKCSIVRFRECVIGADTATGVTTATDRCEGGCTGDDGRQTVQSIVARVDGWMDGERCARRADVLDNQSTVDIDTCYQALLCGVFSSGKTLHRAEYILDNRDGIEHSYDEDLEIECLWEEEDEWYTAQGVNYFQVGRENDGAKKQEEFLRALSKHCDFQDVGRYCVVRWEDNHTFSMVPETYIRQTLD